MQRGVVITMSDLRRRGQETDGEIHVSNALSAISVVIKHRGVVFKGKISRELALHEVCGVVGLPSDSRITVIHKGIKLQAKCQLPTSGCTLLVLDRIDVADIDGDLRWA